MEKKNNELFVTALIWSITVDRRTVKIINNNVTFEIQFFYLLFFSSSEIVITVIRVLNHAVPLNHF